MQENIIDVTGSNYFWTYFANNADSDASSLIWSPLILIHSGCSSWTWEHPKSWTSWSRTPGNTGDVLGRRTFGVTTNYIKGGSFRPSWTDRCLQWCASDSVDWITVPDMVYVQSQSSASWLKFHQTNSLPLPAFYLKSCNMFCGHLVTIAPCWRNISSILDFGNSTTQSI